MPDIPDEHQLVEAAKSNPERPVPFMREIGRKRSTSPPRCFSTH